MKKSNIYSFCNFLFRVFWLCAAVLNTFWIEKYFKIRYFFKLFRQEYPEQYPENSAADAVKQALQPSRRTCPSQARIGRGVPDEFPPRFLPVILLLLRTICTHNQNGAFKKRMIGLTDLHDLMMYTLQQCRCPLFLYNRRKSMPQKPVFKHRQDKKWCALLISNAVFFEHGAFEFRRSKTGYKTVIYKLYSSKRVNKSGKLGGKCDKSKV